jgi:signal transduction histidine kinase
LQFTDPRPLRLTHLGDHPRSAGFPAHHPSMESFLGVRIEVRREVYGGLYLTDKIGSPDFTGEDQALVEALAVAAGMAIENNRLHQLVRELAVIEDRERTARDLHDTVVQHLYAVGISLETLERDAEAAGIADRLAILVSDIGDAIRQIRSSIFELGINEEDPGVRASVVTLVRSLAPMLGFTMRVSFDGPIDSVISQSVTEQLLATIREAVTNIGRHAQATEASISVSARAGLCRLRVVDNGIGLDAVQDRTSGLGLANLKRRAEKMHGSMAMASPDGGGTVLEWEVPVSQ